ncbi:hypothetical protein HBI68_122820 [Parastagonospora nodorum]|nr:hypothetical protein HBI76_141500 [Parastagonospora nodorum]KAH5031128.1 hypothetical protein HBI74_086750 [Parastagonospora nodorum]KAH6161664.1 hypothetical protein HBI68_122820 [Parastagonospora nodorum]
MKPAMHHVLAHVLHVIGASIITASGIFRTFTSAYPSPSQYPPSQKASSGEDPDTDSTITCRLLVSPFSQLSDHVRCGQRTVVVRRRRSCVPEVRISSFGMSARD